MIMENINMWAVLVATAAAFLLGGLWYSPKIFGAIWKRELCKVNTSTIQVHKYFTYAASILLSLIAAFVFAIFLGPKPEFGYAVGAGFGIGLCWIATSFGTNYLFTDRNFKMFLIDAGYHIAQFTIYGIILGLWH